jgi:hypothetical protein
VVTSHDSSRIATAVFAIAILGQMGRVGTLATKTLLIAGDGGFSTTASGRGAMRVRIKRPDARWAPCTYPRGRLDRR